MQFLTSSHKMLFYDWEFSSAFIEFSPPTFLFLSNCIKRCQVFQLKRSEITNKGTSVFEWLDFT